MDLALTKEDLAFRQQVRDFLDRKLSADLREAGFKTGGVFTDFPAGNRWQRILHSQGWAAPGWPVEYGGTGWSAMQRFIFAEECACAHAPRMFIMGIRMVGPVLMRFGSDAQKKKYLPRILSGDDVWCQGYSEPGSGSDLASLKMRAERRSDAEHGDHYLLNGTKIWTTFAQHATRMFCLVRTSGQYKPQDGISFVLIEDMKSPGITIKPIITLAGDHEVNQVFFDNVRVPVANLVGNENEGWTVAKYLLEFERGGDAYSPGLHKTLEWLLEISRRERADDAGRLIDEPHFRAALADAEIQVQAVEFTEKRVMSALTNGQNPGAASSSLKIRGSEVLQRLTEMAVEAIGYYALPYEPEARSLGRNIDSVTPDYAITAMPQYLNHRAASIYAGSNEVQRNIIAKAVLGL